MVSDVFKGFLHTTNTSLKAICLNLQRSAVHPELPEYANKMQFKVFEVVLAEAKS